MILVARSVVSRAGLGETGVTHSGQHPSLFNEIRLAGILESMPSTDRFIIEAVIFGEGP